MHEHEEVEVDRELGEVLEEESIGAHELAESDRLLEDRHCVADAE